MSWLGVKPFKKFPTPIAKPIGPFFIAGVVMLYAFNAAQDAMLKTDEWKNDPRNPSARGGH